MKNMFKKALAFSAICALVFSFSSVQPAHATTAMKALVLDVRAGLGDSAVEFDVDYIDPTMNQVVGTYSDALYFGSDITAYTPSEVASGIQSKLIAYAVTQSWTVAAADVISAEPVPFSAAQITALNATKSFTNNASRSFVTTAAAANGFQLSSTRDSVVSYAIQVSTTATIGGGAAGYVVLEIAATNSTTAGDWKEIARVSNSQTISLALALQSVQISGGSMMGMVPAGYYARLRTVTSSGTVSFTYNSGQEVSI